jgi:hypothetical protein
LFDAVRVAGCCMKNKEYKMQRQGPPSFNRRFLAYPLFAHRAKRLQVEIPAGEKRYRP